MTAHLYVHVPFCARRCSYCDFSIAVRRRVPAAAYVAAVRSELEAAPLETVGLATVYLGGGTPSLLPPEALAELFASLRGVGIAPAAEVTLEANPEDVTPDAARAWRTAGVNRVSLGAQSFDAGVLRWMHRLHGPGRTAEAVRTLRAEGITNISLDLIFALPAELDRDWASDLDLALALEVDHLSLYGLTVEERTPLARWISRGAASGPDDERYAADYHLAHDRLRGAGYEFYEVSNAARRGCRSRHNSAYWTGASYRGLGPAAHSFDGRARSWNLAAWEAYRRAVAAGRSPVESREDLTAAQRTLEARYLGLRTNAGLSGDALAPAVATAWQRAGWIERRSDRWVCTVEGWLRLDALVGALTDAERVR